MKILSIVLILIATLAALAFAALAVHSGYLAFTRGSIRDFVALPLLGTSAVLAARCVAWFGSLSRLRGDARKMAEAAAFVALMISLPIVAQLESRTEGTIKALVQLSVVVVAVTTYFFVRLRSRAHVRQAA